MAGREIGGNIGEKSHIVKPGESLPSISYAALQDAFGKPATTKEWSQRIKDEAVEEQAIAKLNGKPNPDSLIPGTHDKNGSLLKVGETLRIPNPEKLFQK